MIVWWPGWLPKNDMPHFDTFPILYWLSVYACCWILLWATLTNRLTSSALFLLVLFSLLFLLRLPSIVFDEEINPDESQMVAQALALHDNPIYFKSVDGTTGGPLDSYLLIIPTWFGLPFDYITARLVAFVLIASSLWLTFLTARLWFGDLAARLVLLPIVFVLGLTQHTDFVSYNSELLAVVLLSASYYLYARLIKQPDPSWKLVFLIGFLSGIVPFCKLQGVPLAAVVCAFAALYVGLRPTLPVSLKVRLLALLVAGGLLFPTVAVLLAWANDVYSDFLTFYILSNFTYASATNPLQNLLNLPQFLASAAQFNWLVLLSAGIGLFWFISSFASGYKYPKNGYISAFLLVLLLATLYSITRTGTGYAHYLYFLIGPLLLCLAFTWQIISYPLATTNRWFIWVVSSSISVFLLLFGIETALNYRSGKLLNPYPSNEQGGWRMAPTPVTTAILRYAHPGEKLVVWGWRNDYYVKAQMPQGVAENHVVYSVYNVRMKEVYHKRYVADFLRSMPPVFVDAVGSQNLWMTDRKTQGHEYNTALAKIIDANYQYIGLVNDTRLYIRKDRLAKLQRNLSLN